MNFTTFFFLFLFFIFIFNNNESHAAKSVCNRNRYTNGSIIERHVNAVISYLVQHAPPNRGFNTTVQGQGEDLISGLVQCRGDTTEEECKACSIQANTTLRQECGNSVGGRVWLDKCYLRYEHVPFIGDLDTTSYLVLNNIFNATDSEAFGSTVKALLYDLSVEVTKSSNLYSSDSAIDRSSSAKIYGLVQCWRDISVQDCADCLDNAIRALVEVNGAYNSEGVVYSGSCTARYDTFPFFASPSNGGNQLHESKKSSNKIPIILGCLGAFVILVLLGGLFALRGQLKSAIFGKDDLIDWPEGSPHRYSSENWRVLQTTLASSWDAEDLVQSMKVFCQMAQR